MLTKLASCGATAALTVLLATTASAQGQTFTFDPVSPNRIQTFVVPAGATMLSIVVEGASGGRVDGAGGKGGRIQGDVAVPAGATLQMIVGRRGQNGLGIRGNARGGGGGGGSYVALGTNGFADFATPLLVAGGGAGQHRHASTVGGHGGAVLGGSGNGGAAQGSNGGGGILTDGGGAGGGRAAVNGANAGTGGGPNGGFGGGGASAGLDGGGGGGYSGGRGNVSGQALGGTSFAAPTVCNVENSPGVIGNRDGRVVIHVHFAPPSVHTFNHTGGLQTFVVPTGAAMLRIMARGGTGGGSNQIVGGPGGRITGDVCLPAGTTLQMLVGQRGQGGSSSYGGGGGGGTFVAVGTAGAQDFATPLLVAGGGGGRSLLAPHAGGHGGLVLGGSGQGGATSSVAGCGAGIVGNGADGTIGTGGIAAAAGGAGGTGHTYGGFGGGGAGANNHGGGGGGYTGGDPASATVASTGGSSFADASMFSVVDEPGEDTYHNGRVRIEVYYAADVEDLGQGCAGDKLRADTMPWTNSTFSVTGTGLPNTSLVLTVTGFSSTLLPLTAVWPQANASCNLVVSPDLVDAQLTGNGTATSLLALPDDPALVGQQFQQQMVSLAVDAALQVTNVTATNSLRMTVGS